MIGPELARRYESEDGGATCRIQKYKSEILCNVNARPAGFYFQWYQALRLQGNGDSAQKAKGDPAASGRSTPGGGLFHKIKLVSRFPHAF